MLNRAQIIDDLFNLAKVNFVDYNLVMRATQYLQNEVDVVPWYSVKKGFEYLLNRMWRYPDGYKYLKVIRFCELIIIKQLKHFKDYLTDDLF